LYLTRHAEIRAQQRGIPLKAIEILFEKGKRIRQKGGSTVVCFSRKQQTEISTRYKSIKHLSKTYLVVEGDRVLTAAYRHKKLKGLKNK